MVGPERDFGNGVHLPHHFLLHDQGERGHNSVGEGLFSSANSGQKEGICVCVGKATTHIPGKHVTGEGKHIGSYATTTHHVKSSYPCLNSLPQMSRTQTIIDQSCRESLCFGSKPLSARLTMTQQMIFNAARSTACVEKSRRKKARDHGESALQ